MRNILLLLGILIMFGCVKSNTATYYTEEKISAPKLIVLDGPPSPWKEEVQKRLVNKGFMVVGRGSSSRAALENESGGVEIRIKTASRYMLTIDGSANQDALHKCFGGGYSFTYINAVLVDMVTGEPIATYRDTGFSENCPPLSGTIFTDLTDTIVQAWKQ